MRRAGVLLHVPLFLRKQRISETLFTISQSVSCVYVIPEEIKYLSILILKFLFLLNFTLLWRLKRCCPSPILTSTFLFVFTSFLCRDQLSSSWTKFAPIVYSLVGNAIPSEFTLYKLYLHPSCLPLCQSIITALCRLSFLRANLRFLPAHKSQTQSGQTWQEPSNHPQPQKEGRGYLTPVPISSHLARTHT